MDTALALELFQSFLDHIEEAPLGVGFTESSWAITALKELAGLSNDTPYWDDVVAAKFGGPFTVEDARAFLATL